jgi:putative membrane-bound dehydrogenase-like protein
VAVATATPLSAAADEPPQPAGLTPDQAVARMTVPDGFRVEVFASEPEIRQPVAAAFDERGRMWVVEYLQYPTPNGLKPVSVDVYLRTEYDRVPEPPPHGPRGADRVKILEDTDGDGKADRSTVFVEGLNLASGVAVGHGGVFVAQAPYLLFYPDRDKDDRPDGDPAVLLTGFGLQDAHAVVNSLAWGPDGWLYGAQGSTVTAKIRGAEFQQGIWRYHPITKEFELFAEGGGNTWGLDFDRKGRIFGSSNGAFIAFHMVQGGYYWKGFAKHGPLHNPRSYGYFNSIAYTGPKQGGHVTPGGILYKGDNFPDSFQGAFIGGNLLSNAVYWHDLEPKGSTVMGRHGGTLIDSHDTWFRPIDLLTGPDGCVYVVDWYDKRASHLDPRDNWDKTNGRIYRVVHGERPKVEPFDLSKWSSDDLVGLRDRRNDWWPEMARRILAERRDASILPRLRRLVEEDRDEPLALRDLWTLDVSGGIDRAAATKLLDHPVAGVRRWGIRLLGDHRWMDETLRTRLVTLAGSDPDSDVRSQLASSCQRWAPDDAVPILASLARRDEDATDEHIPLQIWWASEKAFRADPGLVLDELASSSMQSRPIVREVLLERIARASASDGNFALCGELFERSPGEAESRRILAGVEKGLEGRALDEVPPPMRRALDRLRGSHGDIDLLRFAVRLGDDAAYRAAAARASDPKTPQADRLPLLELIGQVARPSGLDALLAMLARDEPDAVAQAVLNALGGYAEPKVADAILARYPSMPAALRPRTLDRLTSRREWASRLLDAMADGRISTKDLTTSQAQQLGRLGDPALTERLTKVWGALPGADSEARRLRIAEVRGILPEGDKGSPARGRSVFQKNCAGCHRLFNEGQSIGPELTGAERGNLDFLLESLVDPSSVMRKEFQPQTVATKDGRVLNGLVVEESDAAVTIFDTNQQRTVIPKAEVEEMAPSAVSIMPEGLLDKLPDSEVRDLFRYLQSSGPTM